MSDRPTKTFDIIFKGHGAAQGKMRNDIEVQWPDMNETFDLPTDEGAFHGGDGTAPPPLAYFTAALIGCLMTQMRAFSKRLRLEITDLNVDIELHWRAEQQGTAPYNSKPVGFRVDIDLQSPVSLEKRIELIEYSKRGCFIEQSLSNDFEITHRLRDGDHWVDI